MIGRTLAHYTILDALGTGGMGNVYLALDTRLNRKVALKTLRSGGEATPMQLSRIRREAKATAALNHPGVVTVHSVEEAEGIIFITMEHVAGRTLDQVIGPEGVDEGAFRDLAGQIAAAVAAAHAQGITHRDLKPGNVMIDDQGRVKVLDFGLAVMAASEASVTDPTLSLDLVTSPGTILGTMPYMSPEQVRGEPADARSDVFSLGSVFYLLACGKRPFGGSCLAEIASSILRDQPAAVDEVRPGFPGALARVIRKCLQNDPAHRFANAGELAAALDREVPGPAASTGDHGDAPRLFGVADFRNISRDTSADWLCTGIAETVTVDLNKLPGIQTLPRDQVSAAWSGLDSTDEDAVLRATRSLDLDFLVTGGFQKQGERIRITGQILDVRRNTTAGSVKLDGVMDEIFTLQDKVLGGLLAAVDSTIAPAATGGPRPGAPAALLAYEKYSRAKAKILHMGVGAFAEAEELLREALKLDPDYAMAHTAFGQMRAMRFIATTDRRDLTEAIEHLERAIGIDPELDEPWVWLTYSLGRLDRFEESIAAGHKAIAANPARPQAHYFTGIAYWLRGASNYQTGDWEEAARHLGRAMQLQPTYQPAFMGRFDVLFRRGRWREARRDGEFAAEVEASGQWAVAAFYGAETQLGLLEFAENHLDAAERRFRISEQRLSGSVHVYAPVFLAMNFYGLAAVAKARGDHETALSLLREARDLGDRYPRALGMGRVQVRVGYASAAALAASGQTDEAAQVMAGAERSFLGRDHMDFSGVWMNMDADLYVECARSRTALGQPDLAAAAIAQAETNGWRPPDPAGT